MTIAQATLTYPRPDVFGNISYYTDSKMHDVTKDDVANLVSAVFNDVGGHTSARFYDGIKTAYILSANKNGGSAITFEWVKRVGGRIEGKPKVTTEESFYDMMLDMLHEQRSREGAVRVDQ